MFKPSFGKIVEERYNHEREADSHQIGNKNTKRKRLEENCKESPRMKKLGNGVGGGGYWSVRLIWSKKLARLMRVEGVVT